MIPADILTTMANETAPTWMRPYRNVASQTGSILGKYLADRGPHLAAMVAYYALLSLFPFIFLRCPRSDCSATSRSRAT